MTISVQQFRIDFPEFSSIPNFPNSGVQFWLDFAYKMLNADRFGNVLDMAAELFAAHFIVIEARNLLASSKSGIPGQSSGGPISSKSVDMVSISYDTGAGTEPGAGHWNLTDYGIRLMWMINMFGSGPVQLGAGYAPVGSISEAWIGPDTTPGFSNFS